MPHPRRPPVGRRHPRPCVRAGRRRRRCSSDAVVRTSAAWRARRPPTSASSTSTGTPWRRWTAGRCRRSSRSTPGCSHAAAGDGGGRARPPAGDADRRPGRPRAAGRVRRLQHPGHAPRRSTASPSTTARSSSRGTSSPTRCSLPWAIAAVCILRGHGITVAGESVEQATVTAVDLDELCAVTVRLAQLGATPPAIGRRRSRRAPRPRQRLQRHPPLASPRRRPRLNPDPPTCLLQMQPRAV